MLVVKTYLAVSSIHGVGVFAAEDIRAGELIWRIHPTVDRRLTRQEFWSLPEFIRIWLAPDFVTEDDTYFFCGDNARFMNHSFEPNTRDVDLDTVAARDISGGDELTYDYREMQIDDIPYFPENPSMRDEVKQPLPAIRKFSSKG